MLSGRRPIIQLKDTDISQGKLNQMASGFGNANSTFGKDFIVRLICHSRTCC